jgi:adenine phosphoribosyltransferase
VGAKAKQVNLREIIANYPDFPKQGILFRDINPVFKRNDALNYIADEFYRIYSKAKVDMVAGIESRGFIIATALALRFGRGIVMIRKAGKLPGRTIKKSYDIEYGTAIMELQQDVIEELGGKVAGFAFIIELSDLKGADRLRKMGYTVESLVTFDGE